MKTIKKISGEELADMFKNANRDWDGKDYDGGTIGDLDDVFRESGYVRIGVLPDYSGIVLFSKKAIKGEVDKLSKKQIKKINKRMAKRFLSTHNGDYLDDYFDLLDPVLDKIKHIDRLYVNAYDCVLDEIFNKDMYDKYIEKFTKKRGQK